MERLVELESDESNIEPAAGRTVAATGRGDSSWVSLGIGGVAFVLCIISGQWVSIFLGAGFFCLFLGPALAATSPHRWSRVVTDVIAAAGCGFAFTAIAIAPTVADRLAGAFLLAAVLLGLRRPRAAQPKL